MSLSTFIEQLTTKAKNLEAAVAQSIQNHNGILGMLRATQEAIAEATKLAEAIAPTSTVTEALDAVDTVAEALIPDEPASPVSASGSSDASSSDEAASS